MTARLKETYNNEVFGALKEKFQYKNVMEVPKLVKITINMGLGEAKENSKIMESAVQEMALISGQKPVITKAKKSIANFKVRQGMAVGAKVTLRGDNMYEFADKFFNIALPRVRDFKGVSNNSFDGRGNYSMGIKEQLIFPEINYDDVETIKGMNIVFTTTAKTDEEAYALLEFLGFVVGEVSVVGLLVALLLEVEQLVGVGADEHAVAVALLRDLHGSDYYAAHGVGSAFVHCLVGVAGVEIHRLALELVGAV